MKAGDITMIVICKLMLVLEKRYIDEENIDKVNTYKYSKQSQLFFGFVCILYISISANSFADVIKHKDPMPVNPRIMGMGNGFSAQAEGLHSLWTNPAGLSKEIYSRQGKREEITAFAFTGWTQPLPADFARTISLLISKDLDPAFRILSKTGIRAGASLHGGYMSQFPWGSIGLMLMNINDFSAYTPDGTGLALQSTIISQTQLSMGYAYEFELGISKIRTGVALRPLWRTHNRLNSKSAISAFIESGNMALMATGLSGLHGFAVASDVGVQAEWQGITLGVDAHNIYTPIFYTSAKTIHYFSGNSSSSAPSDTYMLPLYFNFGIAYDMGIDSLRWLEKYLDIMIYFQLSDPVGMANVVPNRNEDFAKHINFGLEARILKPLANMQLGFNKGGPTFGMGFDLWFVDISFAIYTEEEGIKLRERTTPGFATELAFRW